MTGLQTELESASTRAGKLGGTLAEMENNLKTQLLAQFDSQNPEQAGTQVEGRLNQRLNQMVRKLSELEKEVGREQDRSSRKAEVDGQLPALELRISEMERDIADGAAWLASASARRDALREQIRQLREKLEFPGKKDAETEISRLESECGRLEKAGKDAAEAREQAQNQIKLLEGESRALREQIREIPVTDEAALKTEKAELQKTIDMMDSEQKEIHARMSSNRRVQKSLRENEVLLKELEGELSVTGVLADTAAGTLSGKPKIMLETYVQSSYFDRIIGRANVRFLRMTRGQYELRRRMAADQNRSQSGLELDVLDHYNNSLRDVRTLSGGESFMASLSLALGLSDEIQASAGGIRLDSMYVDEGFGTLDDEALTQALDALASLAESDRLVGIISHVEGLAERIDRQIIIHKNRQGGSTAEIVV